MAVAGGYAFVADFTGGLRVIDVSNPSSPVLAGAVGMPPDQAWGVAVTGTLAHVADANYGFSLVDISNSNPASPAFLGRCETPDYAYRVAVAGSFAYISDGASGLQVVQIGGAAAAGDARPARPVPRIDPSFPNPFRRETTLRYVLGEAAATSLRIYSASGQLVRVLEEAEATEPGEHRVRWDGRDDRGRSLPAGVYFFELRSEGSRAAARIGRAPEAGARR